MKLFYKKNSKLINTILVVVFVIANFVLATDYFRQGKEAEGLRDLKIVHYFAKRRISQNLQTKCNILADKQIQNALKLNLSNNGIGYHLVSENVVSINDLIFKEVIFNTYSLNSASIKYISRGYLVENTLTKTCYGLI
jgi:hypothetical protein